MRFSIKLIVYSSALGIFLFSGVTFAAQGTAAAKAATEQCSKAGKMLPGVNTKDECAKQGGSWVKMQGQMRPPDPLEKNKVQMPDDPFGKNKAMPVDPLEKNKAMPSPGQMAPGGGQ